MNLVGVIDKIISLVWTRRYSETGGFKLLVPCTPEHVDILEMGMIVMRKDDDEAGQIRYIRCSMDGQGLETIEIQGSFLRWWLGKRLIQFHFQVRDITQNIIKHIINDNVINPGDTARKIPNLYFGSISSFGREAFEYEPERWANVLETCELLAKGESIGLKIITDIETKSHFVEMYACRNLSESNGFYTPRVFSAEYDNVVDQSFTQSTENKKTTIVVGGYKLDSSPNAQRVVTVHHALQGHERDESYLDCSSLTPQRKNEQGIDYYLNDMDYVNMLLRFGFDERAQRAEVLSFEGRLNPRSNLKYKEDFDLGDIVTVREKRWRKESDVRIEEIEETHEEGKEEINITFGEPLPTLAKKITQGR